MKKLLFALVSMLIFTGAQAEIQIKIKDGSGHISTISSDGQKARIEDEQTPGYVIIDYVTSEFLSVDPQRKEVLQFTIGAGGSPAVEAGEQLSISLQDKGKGPTIAGYKTRQYDLIANGGFCGSIFASKSLLNEPGIRELFDSMRNMQRHSRDMMSGMGSFMGLCERANLQFADALGGNGAPLRVTDEKGKLQSEVLEVKIGQKFSKNYYRVPDGMTLINMDDKMDQTVQQTQQMMPEMPDMNAIMEQIQQSGEMTPEMMEQMKKLQEQFQQYQQQ